MILLFVKCTGLRRLIRAGRNNGRHRRRPECLVLEDRRLLATINVTSAADDGSANTLRWAIGVANTADTPTSIDIELGTGARHDHARSRPARAEQHLGANHDL